MKIASVDNKDVRFPTSASCTTALADLRTELGLNEEN
jgi:hypothetical protein